MIIHACPGFVSFPTVYWPMSTNAWSDTPRQFGSSSSAEDVGAFALLSVGAAVVDAAEPDGAALGVPPSFAQAERAAVRNNVVSIAADFLFINFFIKSSPFLLLIAKYKFNIKEHNFFGIGVSGQKMGAGGKTVDGICRGMIKCNL